jgi:hypothetical protein
VIVVIHSVEIIESKFSLLLLEFTTSPPDFQIVQVGGSEPMLRWPLDCHELGGTVSQAIMGCLISVGKKHQQHQTNSQSL